MVYAVNVIQSMCWYSQSSKRHTEHVPYFTITRINTFTELFRVAVPFPSRVKFGRFSAAQFHCVSQDFQQNEIWPFQCRPIPLSLSRFSAEWNLAVSVPPKSTVSFKIFSGVKFGRFIAIQFHYIFSRVNIGPFSAAQFHCVSFKMFSIVNI